MSVSHDERCWAEYATMDMQQIEAEIVRVLLPVHLEMSKDVADDVLARIVALAFRAFLVGCEIDDE